MDRAQGPTRYLYHHCGPETTEQLATRERPWTYHRSTMVPPFPTDGFLPLPLWIYGLLGFTRAAHSRGAGDDSSTLLVVSICLEGWWLESDFLLRLHLPISNVLSALGSQSPCFPTHSSVVPHAKHSLLPTRPVADPPHPNLSL